MRPDQILELAQAIYAARFKGAPPRTVTPWGELTEEAKETWLRCARAAAVVESKRCSTIAKMHAHHALWTGLISHGWDETTELFGRGLAHRIADSIMWKVRDELLCEPITQQPGKV
jgi:hypothetical protein